MNFDKLKASLFSHPQSLGYYRLISKPLLPAPLREGHITSLFRGDLSPIRIRSRLISLRVANLGGCLDERAAGGVFT